MSSGPSTPPWRPLRDRYPIVLGVVAAVVIAGLVAGTIAVGRLGFGQATYRAELAQTAGLRSGDEVRVAGIGVGEVTGLALAGDRVEVNLRVEREVVLGDRTRATVKLSTLLGGRYLELAPEGEQELPDDLIPLANTSVPFDLQDVLETGTPKLEALDQAALRQALGSVRDTLRGTGPQIGAALDGVSRLSLVITRRQQQIRDLLDAVGRVTTLVDDRKTQLFALVGQADGLLAELLGQRELVRRSLADVATLSRQLRGLLEDNRDRIEPVIRELGDLTALLRRNDDSIDRALELLAPASRYFTNATGNGPYLDLALPYGLFPDNLLCRVRAVSGCR